MSQIASAMTTGAARRFSVSAAERSRWACSIGRERARQPTAEPAVRGTAAQTVPTAYSWRSRTGTVGGWLSSLEKRICSLVIVREVSRAIDLVPGQVVPASVLVELGEQALADRAGVRGRAEVDPLVDLRCARTVGELGDLHLAVDVPADVDRSADGVAQLGQGLLELRLQGFTAGQAGAEEDEGVPDHIGAVGDLLDVPLTAEHEEQRGEVGHGQAGFARDLDVRHSAAVPRDRLEDAQGVLHRVERRGGLGLQRHGFPLPGCDRKLSYHDSRQAPFAGRLLARMMRSVRALDWGAALWHMPWS